MRVSAEPARTRTTGLPSSAISDMAASISGPTRRSSTITTSPSSRPKASSLFVLTMNCLNGFFTLPYFDALGEKLVTANGRGAIATFSPSGLSLNEPAVFLRSSFTRPCSKRSPPGSISAWATAVLAAQEDYAETGAFPELLAIYHLFGDPALLMRSKPSSPPSTPLRIRHFSSDRPEHGAFPSGLVGFLHHLKEAGIET